MADAITIKALQDASLDAKSLEEVVNGDEVKQVTTRKGETYPSVKKAIKTMFENGGLPATPFETKALMMASALVDGDYAIVTDDTANNGLYVKNASTWVKSSYDPVTTGVAYTNSALEQYFAKSVNLFNPDAAEIGFSINPSGEKTASSSYSVSEMITVEPNTVYTMAREPHSQKIAFVSIAFYDANKTFMARVNYDYMPTGYQQITTPVGARFVILNINGGLPNEGKRMFYKGTEELPYIPYTPPKLKDVEWSDATTERLSNSFMSADYVSKSYNLFNPESAMQGFVVTITGEIADSLEYSVSDFIPITHNAAHTMYGTVKSAAYPFAHIAYYDENKQFIERVGTSGTKTDNYITVTTPNNPAIKYARLNINAGLPTEHKRMFVEGDSKVGYQPYGQTLLTGLKLADDVIAGIDIPSGGGTTGEGYWYSRPMNEVYNTDKVWTQYTDWNNIKTVAVYQMFDDLMAAYPDYITKKVLGTDPVDNSTIAAYYFKPTIPPSNTPTKRPKVFSICGIHGMEHVPPLTHYLMLKGMCEDWETDPMLEALRFNVEWIIIPVANPWGFDRFTRLNGNGIDLNRNFPTKWKWVDPETDPGHYAGESAASEPETQFMMQIMDENPDIDIMLDCHSFNGNENHHHISWLSSTVDSVNCANMQQLFQSLSSRLDAKWRKDFEWYPLTNLPIIRQTNGAGDGYIKAYANEKGVTYPATFEVGARWWDKAGSTPFTDYHVKSVVEVTVNWYLMLLNSLGK